jgi:exo-1,4-beta-D-glucosaminidase
MSISDRAWQGNKVMRIKWKPTVILGYVIIFILIDLYLPAILTSKSHISMTSSAQSSVIPSTNWQMQSSIKIGNDGAQLSQTNYQGNEWYKVSVPTSVMGGLIANEVFKSDPLVGTNLQSIDEAQFRDAFWWFRNTFQLPVLHTNEHAWLKLEGLSYKAQVWLNGSQLGDPTPHNSSYANQIQFTGPFRTYWIDVTASVHSGKINAIAIGLDRAESPYSDFTIHFVDWNPDSPDLNMGILNDVGVRITGPIRLDHSYIVTNDLTTDLAHITVYADLINSSNQTISSVLQGKLGNASFSTPVTIKNGETQTVSIPIEVKHPTIW